MRDRKRFDRTGLIAGLAACLTLAAAVYAGSIGLKHFDRSIIGYAIGSGLASFAVGYRLAIWMKRPPSRMYFKRGLQLLFKRALKTLPWPSVRAPHDAARSRVSDAIHFAKAFATNFISQSLIRRRSYYRWIMHLCLSGGCTLAFAITFPLVFGWVHFESFAENAEMYRVKLFGLGIDSFEVHGTKAFIAFNLLNFASIIVLVGLVMAAARRITSAEERATQKFSEDILPLLLIGGVTVTGLMLTFSYKFLDGRGHSSVAIMHMFSVIALVVYIPFGKLFHMFQRTCSLVVALYKKAGAEMPRAACFRCGDPFASQIHVADLKIVLDQLGFNYRFATPQGELHYQDICPACRRRLLGLNQGRTLNR